LTETDSYKTDPRSIQIGYTILTLATSILLLLLQKKKSKLAMTQKRKCDPEKENVFLDETLCLKTLKIIMPH
jgi:hypothetical protein